MFYKIIVLCGVATVFCEENVDRLSPISLISTNKIQTDTGIKQVMPNAATKLRIPAGAGLVAHHTMMSATRDTTINHPQGAEMFPQHKALATHLNALLKMLNNPEFAAISYLRKVQFLALHDIFQHLVAIRTTLNLTHPRVKEDESLTKKYLADEVEYATTAKAMLINHLLNIVQAQLFHIMINYFPTLPGGLATMSGMLLMQNDYGTDLNFLLQEFELDFFGTPQSDNPAKSTSELQKEARTIVQATQAQYLQALQEFDKFFAAYTSLLDIPSSSPFIPNEFYSAALGIAPKITQHLRAIQKKQESAPQSTNATDAAKNVAAIKASYMPLNPPLFMYSKETLRALRSIPFLAEQISKAPRKIPWPEQLVAAAKKGERAKSQFGDTFGYPIAFFKTVKNEITNDESQAARLYIYIPLANSLYEQEVVRQPDWMQKKEGIFKMLKACLGNFQEIIGLNILSPCLEAIITKANALTPEEIAGKVALSMSNNAAWQKCQERLAIIKKTQESFVKKEQSQSPESPFDEHAPSAEH